MTTEAQSTAAPGAETRRLVLTFTLAGERLALDVAHVSEVLPPLPITPVPRADRIAPALMNVRGTVVPVMDLRHRLALPADDNPPERFLVLALEGEDGTTRLAIEADEVDRIIEVASTAIEPVPSLGLGLPHHFVEGVARHDGVPVFFLNPATVFDPAIMPGCDGTS